MCTFSVAYCNMHKKRYQNSADILVAILHAIGDANDNNDCRAKDKAKILMDMAVLPGVQIEAYLSVLVQNELLNCYYDNDEVAIYTLTENGRNFLRAYEDIIENISLFQK